MLRGVMLFISCMVCANMARGMVSLVQTGFVTESLEKASYPQLLVLAAIHGAGSTMFSGALNEHPCIISVGEPFGAGEHLYVPSSHPEENAIFRDGMQGDKNGHYDKLIEKINSTLGFDIQVPRDLQMHTSSFSEFFGELRDEVCAHYFVPTTCYKKCIFSHKLFPDYVYNEMGVTKKYLTNKNTAVVHLMRDEAAVNSSNTRRFNGYAPWKLERDREWNTYLTNISKYDLPADSIWFEVHAEQIFPSAKDYFGKLKKFFQMMDIADEALIRPVEVYIENQFKALEEAQHRAR